MLFLGTPVGVSTLAFFLVATSSVALIGVASLIIIGFLKRRKTKFLDGDNRVQNLKIENQTPEAKVSKPEVKPPEPSKPNPPQQVRPQLQLDLFDLVSILQIILVSA